MNQNEQQPERTAMQEVELDEHSKPFCYKSQGLCTNGCIDEAYCYLDNQPTIDL